MESHKSPALQLETVDQISVAVKDIDKVIEAWSAMFGIGPWTFTEIGGTDAKGRTWKARMAFAYLGPVQIELVQPTEGRIFQSRFLDTFGDGLHHLGFYVDDVDKEASKLVADGAKLLITDPGRFAYLDCGGPGGVIFELMKRPDPQESQG
ncbi:MAG: VOC family protein [Deltaproteobacteria bacterium]|nr:VOC family protein [Deltaproteobacteria bacterium]